MVTGGGGRNTLFMRSLYQVLEGGERITIAYIVIIEVVVIYVWVCVSGENSHRRPPRPWWHVVVALC